jgi:hypothetical protein
MRDELKLRVWRSEAIGEFHHVSNIAHPTSKFLHQSLALCFVEQGAYNVRHCGVNYSVGKGALLVAQSGEITSDDDFDGKSKYRDFHCAPKALETIAEEIGDRFRGGRIFQSPFMCDESLCRPFLRFHTKMDSKPSAMESSCVFAGEGDNVYHCYSSYTRGTEFLMGYYAILDRTPKGRDEGGPMGTWVHRHDEYEKGASKDCCS